MTSGSDCSAAPTGLTVIEARDSKERADWLRLHNEIATAYPQSIAEIDEEDTAYSDSTRYVAYSGALPVGMAHVRKHPTNHESPTLPIAVRVSPTSRQQGVGTALYKNISRQARLFHSEPRLSVLVHDDDVNSLTFWTHRGFQENERWCPVALDLVTAEDSPVRSVGGIEVVPLSARTDLLPGVHALVCEALEDMPFAEPMTPPKYERWLNRITLDTGGNCDGCFVAVENDGALVGMTALAFPPARPTVAKVSHTAVARSWRGRGLATALKARQIAWAREAGYRLLETFNQDDNPAIRHINERLGFQPLAARIIMGGPPAP